MLEFKDIEYGELLTRCAYGEINAYGHRFYVGNYVVIFRNARGVVYIAEVCETVLELRKRLLELVKEFEDCKDVEWDIYRVVPTCDDDEETEDDSQPSRFTVLVPYAEFPYREFYAALLAGFVADPYGFGGGLLRGDLVAVKPQDDGHAPYRIVNVYDFIDAGSTMAILKEYVTEGVRLLLLS